MSNISDTYKEKNKWENGAKERTKNEKENSGITELKAVYDDHMWYKKWSLKECWCDLQLQTNR